MKLITWFAMVCIWLAGVSAAWARNTEMSVQIQTGHLRETPNFLGRVVTAVSYGDRVSILSRQAPWSQVSTSEGKSGWIHDSALTRDRIVMKAGAEDVNRTASGEELALAGKGFNSQVEADFKERNKEVDFTWIDRMEEFTVSEQEIVKFLKEGGLQK
ncbi:MAG TPA: SH3 domain-containing protein [Kiritimatiellia bacterium]|nr:SH3 domain-containing protein [Kiritimatiellia bacterium]